MKQAVQFIFLAAAVLSFPAEAQTVKRRADSLAFQIHLDKSEYLRGETV